MEIKSRNEFAAAPATVAAMLTDRAYLEEVARQSGATSQEVTVEGSRTMTRYALAAPPQAQKFTGATITILQDVTWSAPAADGARTGRLDLSVPGMPVDMDGQASLRPGGKGTIVEYTGTLKVNIPFVGKKLEQQASPFIVEALGIQQRVGDEWLAR